MYQYKAKVISIYDGDTITLIIDLGFNLSLKESVRLVGIDCPEIRTKNKLEKKLAYEARDYLRELLLEKEVVIETEKDDKYGRYLVNLFWDNINVNNELIRMGFARPYDGKKRQLWFPNYVEK